MHTTGRTVSCTASRHTLWAARAVTTWPSAAEHCLASAAQAILSCTPALPSVAAAAAALRALAAVALLKRSLRRCLSCDCSALAVRICDTPRSAAPCTQSHLASCAQLQLTSWAAASVCSAACTLRRFTAKPRSCSACTACCVWAASSCGPTDRRLAACMLVARQPAEAARAVTCRSGPHLGGLCQRLQRRQLVALLQPVQGLAYPHLIRLEFSLLCS